MEPLLVGCLVGSCLWLWFLLLTLVFSFTCQLLSACPCRKDPMFLDVHWCGFSREQYAPVGLVNRRMFPWELQYETELLYVEKGTWRGLLIASFSLLPTRLLKKLLLLPSWLVLFCESCWVTMSYIEVSITCVLVYVLQLYGQCLLWECSVCFPWGHGVQLLQVWLRFRALGSCYC